MSGEVKICQNCKNQFTIELEDSDFYKKISVPPPTFCWECRFQRRALFRNERKLFWNKSAKSGKEILSIYPPESGMTIYDEPEWWSDDWDPMRYGREYDFSRSFFEQFFELSRSVPAYSRDVVSMVNSDYSANAGYLKNCYLLFNSNHDEDCAYGNAVDECQNCFDNSHIQKCERCYNSFWLTKCYRTHFSSQCEECSEVWFSKNCRGCNNCFGCANLRNKKYHIFNVPHTGKEYEAKMHAMRLDTWSGVAAAGKAAHEFWHKFPVKYLQGIKNTNVVGEYVTHSKNIYYGYLVREGENLKYVQYLQVPPNKDCYDISVWGENNQLAYENSVCGLGTFNVKFCFSCWPEVRNLEYCMLCKSSSDLFGCFGLRKKEYCILNKQYSKSEYHLSRDKIIQHMHEVPYTDRKGRIYRYGEFFPVDLSPYAYNQTIAIEQLPLSKEEAEAQGYRWRDPEPREYETTMTANRIPDSVSEVNDDILKQIIQCSRCKRAYRLIAPELSFLQAEKIPIPRMCVDCRHELRILWRNKVRLYPRQCVCDYRIYKNSITHAHHKEGRCLNEFETSYVPERSEIVYCEQCYNAEVV